MKKLFANVPVLDTWRAWLDADLRAERIGDVLLAWENEAFLALDELGADKFDIVVPSPPSRPSPRSRLSMRSSTPRGPARRPKPI